MSSRRLRTSENPYQSPGESAHTPAKRQVLLWGAVLSAAHVLAWFQLFCAHNAVAAALQTAGAAPERWQTTISSARYVLSMPLGVVMPYVPGYLLDPLVVVNSTVWGFGLSWLLSEVVTRRHA